jgi:RHS repeat-associated protein
MGTPDHNQDFTLDQLGNWLSFFDDELGELPLDQDRTHNAANEITDITTNTGLIWVDPVYNAAGCLISGPQSRSEGDEHKFIYDAWDRLVKVTDGSDVTIAEYEYDGLNRRIVKEVYSGGQLDRTFDYYFNAAWQILEVRLDGDADPLKQYIWHGYYIDGQALMYHDPDVSGTGVFTHYATHDAAFNRTATVWDNGGAGVVIERYDYDGAGRVRYLNGSFGSAAPFFDDDESFFAGYRFDLETGLYQVRHRQYHPTLGRWLQRDPLGYVDGMSLYGYHGLDPMGLSVWWERLIDPLGSAYRDIARGLRDSWTRAKAITSNTGDSGLIANVQNFATVVTGMQDLAEGIAGVDVADGRLLGPLERALKGTIGAVSGASLAVGGGAAASQLGTIVRSMSARALKFSNASDVAAEIARRVCFVAGTLVLTALGPIPIEQVKRGDQVWSYDHGTAQWRLAEVAGTQEREYIGDMVEMTVTVTSDGVGSSTETITCTGSHPFWVTSGIALAQRPAAAELPASRRRIAPETHTGRWTEARWLRVGDHFLNRTGKSATVSGLAIRMERVRVYNLTVARLHNYAVLQSGVLVHNSCEFVRITVEGQYIPRYAYPRASSSSIRKRWEDFFDQSWPKIPGTRRDAIPDHNWPLSDGGSNHPHNITPRMPDDHLSRHADDFPFWARPYRKKE